MKKLTVVALALTAAFQAQAVEVYKNESTLLDLYGRIYAGQFFGEKKELDANGDIKNEYSDKQGANQFVRLGAKVESEINPGLKALAQYELQMYINDSEKTVSENSDNLRTRLAFAGVGANWGTVTFGRQKGAPGFLADWTDVSLSDGYGNDALGAGLRRTQRVDHSAEQEVLRLLLLRQLVERHQARVQLVLGVLVRAVLPTLGKLVIHPRLVGGFGADVLVPVEVHSGHGAVGLPAGRVLPRGLRGIALRLAVGPVDLVGNTGDLVLEHAQDSLTVVVGCASA